MTLIIFIGLWQTKKGVRTLERGKYADAIAVKGNLLDNINTLSDPNNIVLVTREGKMLKSTM
ncbi:MAG: hypothetical protein QXT26_00690 [Thermoproteota archaeon]